jgi:DNA-binding response OmpR family regulator
MKKILIIEDEPLLRANILDLLAAEEFDAIAAENGAIGVQLALSHLPDLIISDVMMPELDGYGVVQALRQNPMTATIPFIFLTAKVDRADLREGMSLGADDYLTKPFRPKELLKRSLQGWKNKRRLRGNNRKNLMSYAVISPTPYPTNCELP